MKIQMVKRLIVAVFLCIAFACSSAYADSRVIESKGISVVVDGELKTFEDVPLIVNGRTMLPLRSLLTNLGVPNDDEHISWNDTDRSVSVLRNITSIVLKVDSTTAYIDGKPVSIDAAAMLYKKNGRVYIPARFVAQALGYQIAWDKYTNRIYIRNSVSYYVTKDILDKSLQRMEALKRYVVTTYRDLSETEYYDVIAIDRDKQILNITSYDYPTNNQLAHMDYSVNGIQYLYTDTSYAEGEDSAELHWIKVVDSDWKYDDDKYFTYPIEIINPRDVVYAGLNTMINTERNWAILTGDVYPVMRYVEKQGGFYDDPDMKNIGGKMEVIVDLKDYSILKISTMNQVGSEGRVYTYYDNCEYSKLDDEFEIVIPADALSAPEREIARLNHLGIVR